MTDYKHEIEDKNKAIVEILKNLQIATVQNYIAAQEDGSELASDLLPDAWHERLYEATTALTHLIETEKKKTVRVVELQARANAYYESADWCKEDPRYYKHFWDKRKEALAKMKELQGEV